MSFDWSSLLRDSVHRGIAICWYNGLHRGVSHSPVQVARWSQVSLGTFGQQSCCSERHRLHWPQCPWNCSLLFPFPLCASFPLLLQFFHFKMRASLAKTTANMKSEWSCCFLRSRSTESAKNKNPTVNATQPCLAILLLVAEGTSTSWRRVVVMNVSSSPLLSSASTTTTSIPFLFTVIKTSD